MKMGTCLTWATISELTSISGLSGYGIMRGNKLVQNLPHISPKCEKSPFDLKQHYIPIAYIYSCICNFISLFGQCKCPKSDVPYITKQVCWKVSIRGDVTRIDILQFCSHISMKLFVQRQNLEHHN